MKLLLDENLPHQMRTELKGHDVFTVAFMNWGGIENGELLRVAAVGGFDVLISNDRGLEYQQNLESLPSSVVVLLVKENTIEHLRPLFPELLERLQTLPRRSFTKISGG
jgi:predicted nuclease of predicted toxin-antitoxin system